MKLKDRTQANSASFKEWHCFFSIRMHSFVSAISCLRGLDRVWDFSCIFFCRRGNESRGAPAHRGAKQSIVSRRAEDVRYIPFLRP